MWCDTIVLCFILVVVSRMLSVVWLVDVWCVVCVVLFVVCPLVVVVCCVVCWVRRVCCGVCDVLCVNIGMFGMLGCVVILCDWYCMCCVMRCLLCCACRVLCGVFRCLIVG